MIAIINIFQGGMWRMIRNVGNVGNRGDYLPILKGKWETVGKIVGNIKGLWEYLDDLTFISWEAK